MSEIKDISEDENALKQDTLAINTIRTLSMDAVQAAHSGHPGTPMALAPVAYCIWQRFLRFDPQDPIWPNRDRFVLSNGHASMLLYALLHLTGVKAVNEKYETLGQDSVTLDDIKKFRQLNSKCPGHPEYRWTSGVETTTGPLGQGVATSVGMALASRWMSSYFNRPDFEMINYSVYVLCGDGDMMEGVSSEAASLAGHLKLSNLCWIFDNNRITIEGSTDLSFSEDIAARFMSYGWNVLRVADANDLGRLERALNTFHKTHDRPTFIIVDSHIAWGSPNKQDTHGAHGEPLGEEEIRLTKKIYGWPEESHFLIPSEVYSTFHNQIGKRGASLRANWMQLFELYRQKYPVLADHLYKMQHRQLPDQWDEGLTAFPPNEKGLATRDSSGQVLNTLALHYPWLIGGSADLSPSTKTYLKDSSMGECGPPDYSGRNLHFGVREHAMGAVLNGLALCKIRPFGSGFLIFSDYCRPPIRLSALMELPVIYIFTHDSIGVGEDGPTHQPIEQLANLRSIPGLITLRPCDANEVIEGWRYLIQLRHQPAALILTRQSVPTLDRKKYGSAEGLHKGGYVIAECERNPELLLLASGSEVALCLSAYKQLTREGVACRVISMPSWEIFEMQSESYKATVLPPDVPLRLSVEQASTFGWQRYTGTEGRSIGISTFGASAPLKDLLKKFGFTVEQIVNQAKDLLQVTYKS